MTGRKEIRFTADSLGPDELDAIRRGEATAFIDANGDVEVVREEDYEKRFPPLDPELAEAIYRGLAERGGTGCP